MENPDKMDKRTKGQSHKHKNQSENRGTCCFCFLCFVFYLSLAVQQAQRRTAMDRRMPCIIPNESYNINHNTTYKALVQSICV